MLDSELPEQSNLPENEHGPLLLVADDEPVNLRVLDSFLRLEGYRVHTAQDGHQVLEAIKREKPELVLLDIMMPGMSGYQVCEKLRQTYDHAELPIIMLTALNQSDDRVRGLKLEPMTTYPNHSTNKSWPRALSLTSRRAKPNCAALRMPNCKKS